LNAPHLFGPQGQLQYQRSPVDAWFDNSAANFNNPDPRQEVRFGLKPNDKMLIGDFDWLEASE
jgi:hypothetical protein